ncbi:endothelial PAS domain-containing protein 1 isoform X1 [Thalassophryne amazonica]|uniref:endothelial PAS domain-containing protein 1 isoform X1 n=1 Tax=Thalassophryne amazonica TaxID=390379 RepID=UPI0014715E6D|nr:endothelial PAS domain-containing protein 1 isoform X1 [Thalassophryne amazonica]
MTADKEKRRAISREAARRRRRVESDVFEDLSRLLPVQPSIQAHLDKPSVIRLTLSYIRMCTLLRGDAETRADSSQTRKKEEARQQKPQEEEQDVEETNMYLRTLEGFVMVVSADGDIVFLSDNVSTHMGLTQTELMGHNIFEFTHPCDHEEVRNSLRLPAGVRTDLVMRIKSTLTQRGRAPNLKSATWKVLHCQGCVKACAASPSVSCLLMTCRPLPLSHTLLSSHTFSSQHSMDMRFTHCDHRVTALLGYRPEELLGRSLYELCHAMDTNRLTNNHVNLYLKSQSISGQYRMLVRGGGYVWVESHSAVITSVRSSKSRPSSLQPHCVLCVTYVLSGVEEPSLQLSLDQTVRRP